jgi:quinol monooxygenase YgiN
VNEARIDEPVDAGAQISWHVELAVRVGALEAFRTLTGEMVAATRREAGVLAYQRFVSADGKTVHVYERYADADAALAHLETFLATFGARFAALVERRRFEVFGAPTPALRAVLDRFGATYLAPFGDLACWG